MIDVLVKVFTYGVLGCVGLLIVAGIILLITKLFNLDK